MSLPTDSNTLFTSVEDCLSQLESLLQNLNNDQYGSRLTEAMNSSIGAHVRHSLDHFSAVLEGVQSSTIDYDARERELKLETCVEAAQSKAISIKRNFDRLDTGLVDSTIEVRSRVNGENSPSVNSTVGREMMFAVIHAVHHNALISFILNLHNIPLPEGFGIAPSTIAHLRNQT